MVLPREPQIDRHESHKMNELLEKISREEPRNFSFAVNRAAPNDPYHDVKQQPVIPRNFKTLSAGKEKNLELLRQQA